MAGLKATSWLINLSPLLRLLPLALVGAATAEPC